MSQGAEQDNFKSRMTKAVASLSLVMNDEQLEQGCLFLKMLYKWNQVYNFTAVRDLHEMVERHWLDSLAISELIEGSSILDVGTGPGLPGIPLAILHPTKQFCLLDSNERRQLFLKQVVHQANLNNVSLYCGRVEKFFPKDKFQCIISRAFKPLPEMLTLTKHLVEPGGMVLAMKGRLEDKELTDLDHDFTIDRIIPLANSEKGRPKNAVVLKLTNKNTDLGEIN